MRADSAVARALARWKESALYRRLRSPQGLVAIAVALAAVLILVSMSGSMRACTDTAGTTVGSTSLWRSDGTDKDLSRVLSEIEGAGDTDVLITYDKAGVLVGVVVVSAGADDPRVSVKLMRAVQTATGAKMDQIGIFVKSK